MQLVSKFNKGIRFLLCAIDVYSKCTWGVPSEDKKGVTNTNAFQKVLNESGHKGNKIWVDKTVVTVVIICNYTLFSHFLLVISSISRLIVHLICKKIFNKIL